MLHDLTRTDGQEYVFNFISYKFDDKRRSNKPPTSEVAMEEGTHILEFCREGNCTF